MEGCVEAVEDEVKPVLVLAAEVVAGRQPLRQLRRALTPNGTLIIVGGETGGRWLGGFDRGLRAPVVSRFVRQQLATFICSENVADLLVLTELITRGKVTPDKPRLMAPAHCGPRASQAGR